jgi:autotransporter-associated beta strand protein
VQTGGAKIDDGGFGLGGGFGITIAAPLIHDPALATTDGGLAKLGAGTLTLSGNNTFNGNITISNGTLIIAVTGSVSTASNLNIIAGTFDASALGGFTLNSGRTVMGNGAVNGNFTVTSGATIAPGNSVGTLTFSNALTLAAGSVQNFELGATNASDQVIVLGALSLGGTLNVTNLAGFGAGTYTLFTAASVSGALTLGSAPAGYTCALSNSTAAVQLVVTSTNAVPPVFTSAGAASGAVIFSGSNGSPLGNYLVLGSTNIVLPMSNWTRLATNQFDANGLFNFTNVPGADSQKFFRLQLP